MRSLLRQVVTSLSLLTVVVTAAAQTDTLADRFPLAIGNSWTYKYAAASYDLNYASVSDSGVATYIIETRDAGPDSIRWGFFEVRDLERHSWTYFPGWDYYTHVSDSNHFEMIERLTGRHLLYRPGEDYAYSHRPFPFTIYFTDTTTVERFGIVDSTGVATFQSLPQGNPEMDRTSWFSFKKDVGLVQYYFDGSMLTGSFEHINHRLLSSVTTSVRRPGPQDEMVSFRLEQNYPNPFNPLTRIECGITNSEFLILKVFDIVGREVATLINETREPGTHVVEFDGSGLGSGMYFFRMQAGDFEQTRRMVMLR